MIQYTFDLRSTDEIEAVAGQIREKPVAVSASGKVLLAWARLFDEDDFSGFKQKVLKCFHDFTIIGANCHSKDEILNISLDGSGKERGCLLTFLFFEKAGASLYGIESGYREEAREGRELRDLI
nr:hypothetical protein [Lachnospiraceae bacterium]